MRIKVSALIAEYVVAMILAPRHLLIVHLQEKAVNSVNRLQKTLLPSIKAKSR